MKPLAAAVARLYEVFSEYRPAPHLDACTCCTDPSELRMLVLVPLREQTSDDLSRYAHKAMTTIGNVTDYKHFLPRILEVGLDTKSKLEMAQWQTWPQREREAVETFLFEHMMSFVEGEGELSSDEFALLFKKFDVVLPRLEAMLQAALPGVPRWYAQWLYDFSLKPDRLTHDEQVLFDWLLTKRLTEALEKSFFATTGREAELYSEAAQVLEWY